MFSYMLIIWKHIYKPCKKNCQWSNQITQVKYMLQAVTTCQHHVMMCNQYYQLSICVENFNLNFKILKNYRNINFVNIIGHKAIDEI